MAGRTLPTRLLGQRTGLHLPVLGYGGGGIMLGTKAEVAGRTAMGFRMPSDRQAHEALEAAYNEGIRYFDTAPWYGRGQSEHRIGRFLYDVEPRADVILSTKVGRILHRSANRTQTRAEPGPESAFPALAGWAVGWPGSLQFDHRLDYSYDGIMRAYEDSLQRLGMDRVDCLVIHDLDRMHLTERQMAAHLGDLCTGGWRALVELKGSGDIRAYGSGVNHGGCMTAMMEVLDLDFFLVSQVYSLLHHGDTARFGLPTEGCGLMGPAGGALEELAAAQARGIGVVAATVFNAGILVSGPTPDAKCNYRPATEQEKARVRDMQAVCDEFGVPLPAAALQFSLAHPAVASAICGWGSAAEVRQSLEWHALAIPPAFWAALKAAGCIQEDAPTL